MTAYLSGWIQIQFLSEFQIQIQFLGWDSDAGFLEVMIRIFWRVYPGSSHRQAAQGSAALDCTFENFTRINPNFSCCSLPSEIFTLMPNFAKYFSMEWQGLPFRKLLISKKLLKQSTSFRIKLL